jgi:hypothetical protein
VPKELKGSVDSFFMQRHTNDARLVVLRARIRSVARSYGYSFSVQSGDSGTITKNGNIYEIEMGIHDKKFCIVSFKPPYCRHRQMESEVLGIYV